MFKTSEFFPKWIHFEDRELSADTEMYVKIGFRVI
jgi:hypothetical protein